MSQPATTMTTCPECKKSVSRDASKAYPFCCERCRLVDLSRWLDGDYRVPEEPHNL